MRPALYFIRHGQTDWNAEQRFQGQIDVPLNDLGRRQARANGRRLAQLLAGSGDPRFVASPLKRARETMELVRAELGLDPQAFDTDKRLLEIDYGEWQGFTLAEVKRAFPDLHRTRKRDKWNFVAPGERSESYAMQARRFAPWLDEVDRATVCVCHGGILRCVLHLVGGLTGAEAGRIEIPQDRILLVEDEATRWV